MTFSILRAEQLSGKLVQRWAPEPGETARADGRARAPWPGASASGDVRPLGGEALASVPPLTGRSGDASAPRPGSRQETRVHARAPRFGTKLLRGDVL